MFQFPSAQTLTPQLYFGLTTHAAMPSGLSGNRPDSPFERFGMVKTLVVAGLMNVLAGGCAASPRRNTNPNIDLESAFSPPEPTEIERICPGVSPLETRQVQTEIVRSRIRELEDRLRTSETTIAQRVEESLATYDGIVEAVSQKSPDLAKGRLQIHALKTKVTILTGLFAERDDLVRNFIDLWKCLHWFHREDTSADLPILNEELQSYRRLTDFEDRFSDWMIVRLLNRAIERFNAIPNHGDDIPIDGNSDHVPASETVAGR